MKNLTRWNRAGLSRIRYVDGNAVVWLEEMRRSLLERFENSGWAAIQDGAPSVETDIERLERLEQQYESGAEGDLLWEIVRTLSRSAHVLTEHLDVYANERLLRTATQWDNVRRLVEMIDYHPAPPASANTSLVLKVPDGLTGLVDKGFKVKYSPPDGGAAVVYETLEEIEVDEDLNELRLEGWNEASGTLAGGSPWSADSDIVNRLSAGQRVVVTNGADQGEASFIEAVDFETGAITLLNGNWETFSTASARLLVCPEQIRCPELNGSDVVGTGSSHGLALGDHVAWIKNSVWRFRTVLEVGSESVRLDGEDYPGISQTIYRTSKIDRTSAGILFPDMRNVKVAAYASSDTYVPIDENAGEPEFTEVSEIIDIGEDGTNLRVSRYNVLTDKMMDVDQLLIVLDDAKAISVQNVDSEGLVFWGGPGSLKGGDWVVAEDAEGGFKARRVKEIEEQEDRFFLEFEALDPEETAAIIRIFGPFKYEINPANFDRHNTALTEAQLSSLNLVRVSDGWPPALVTGRRVVIEQDETSVDGKSMVATVSNIQDKTVSVDLPPLADITGFTKGNTVIRANVVRVGHGETQPDRVLGSGNAAAANQRFIFKNDDVSFIPDPAMVAGVRADIVITVNNRTWTQVSRLTDSGPADPHFELKITGEGHLQISFGDGMCGRRLPTGSNNIRISWRKGSGLGGMVEAGGLVKPVKPHRLIDAVEQPFTTTGGSDLEDTASLRENAPASLLTLERVVSLSDFKYLATSHSSVWQANAFFRSSNSSTSGIDSGTAVFAREETIEVVVVPSGGGELGELSGTLSAFLEEHSLPGVRVSLSCYDSLPFDLKITIRVKSAQYDPEVVVAEVRSALMEEFSLEKRKLGHSLYRAEVYNVVEDVEGVENSDCELLSLEPSALTDPPMEIVSVSGAIKGYSPGPTQVIHLDPLESELVIDSEEYWL